MSLFSQIKIITVLSFFIFNFEACKNHDPISETYPLVQLDSIPVVSELPRSYKNDLKVFVIGNSFSQCATTYLSDLAKEGGHGLEIGRAELGGCSLRTHWELAVEAELNPTGTKGKAYNGKSLKELLSVGQWDIITIQQYSMESSNKDSYEPYATNLYKYIKFIQPSAEVVIHQTWAYRADAQKFGQITSSLSSNSDLEMYTNLKANYIKLAKQLKTNIIPSGEAFWQMRNNATWAFVPEELKSQTYSYPVLPDQANSLHVGYYWNGDKTLAYDGNHANAAGNYLGSLVWYRYLFGADLRQIVFKPKEVSQPFAGQLKVAATKAFPVMGLK